MCDDMNARRSLALSSMSMDMSARCFIGMRDDGGTMSELRAVASKSDDERKAFSSKGAYRERT